MKFFKYAFLSLAFFNLLGVGVYLKSNLEDKLGQVSANKCTTIKGLPDKTCTRGKINPEITQDNIKNTICSKNWKTGSIRPSSNYTNKLKQQGILDYNLPLNLSLYEEDHLIPLTIGGHPTSSENLWPQAYAGKYGAREKDRVEVWLNKQICSGNISLKEAQERISQDWIEVYIDMLNSKNSVPILGSIIE